MSDITWTNIRVRLGNIRPWDTNPRFIDDQGEERLSESYDDFGEVETIAVGPEDDEGMHDLYNGHSRLKTLLKKYGADFIADARKSSRPLTFDERRKLTIALHEGATGDWDLEKLGELFEEDELLAWGFPDWKLEGVFEDEPETPGEDAPPQEDKGEELREKWGVIKGQLWKLGDHRLLCGDCTSPEDVQLLMDGERAILFATDPPYLVGYDGTNHPHAFGGEDKNKDWSGSYGDVNWDESGENPDLYNDFIATAIAEAITENAAWYCWHASRRQAMLEQVWVDHGAFVHQQIVWVKDRPVLTRSWYMWRHEPCFFGWIKGNKPPRTSEEYPHGVWFIDTIKPGTKTLHPTSKPVDVFEIPMQQRRHLLRALLWQRYTDRGR